MKEPITFGEKYKILIEENIDLDNRIIYITGDLDDDFGTTLRIKYAGLKLYWDEEIKKPFTDITIDINSCGGSIYAISAALDFYDDLKSNNGVLVNVRAQGICMSAATVILAGATGERTAFKRCKFMLHDIQMSTPDATVTQMKDYMKTVSKEQLEFFSFYAEFSREKGSPQLTSTELKREATRWMKKFAGKSIDNYISSEYVLKLKIIDRII